MVSANFYTYFVSFTAGLGGFLFGYEIGVINAVLEMPAFKSFFNLISDSDVSVFNPTSSIVAAFVLGCIPGALSMSYLGQRLGRKKSLWLGCFFFMLGALLQTIVPASILSTQGRLAFMCCGRAFGGIGIGMLSMSVPIFIAELAPTHVRGKLTSMYQFLITIGILMASILNSIFIVGFGNNDRSNTMWRLALGMQLVPGIVLVVLLVFIPESPRWLLSQQREKEALRALAKLHSTKTITAAAAGATATAAPSSSSSSSSSMHLLRPEEEAATHDVQQAFAQMKASLVEDQKCGKASWHDILVSKHAGLRHRVYMAMLLQLFQQWTGINAIMYYSAGLYAQLHFTPFAASTYLVVVQNLANVLATLPAIFLIEKWGRRKLLILGGMGIAIALTSALVCLHYYTTSFAVTVLSVVSIYVFIFFFASTWGPVVWVYQSEIFPQRARERASSLATASNWVNNFLITLFYPYIRQAAGPLQLIPFVIMCCIMTVYVYLFVPETKGRTLEEMDFVFESHGEKKKHWGDKEQQKLGDREALSSSSSSLSRHAYPSVDDHGQGGGPVDPRRRHSMVKMDDEGHGQQSHGNGIRHPHPESDAANMNSSGFKYMYPPSP